MTRVGLFRSLAGAAVLSLLIGGPASALTVGVEIPDAPDLPPGQKFFGPIQEITGNLDYFVGDLVDMFGLYIGSPSGFSATTAPWVAGSTIADPALYLFDSSGMGVYMDDDGDIGGFAQAALGALPAGFGSGWYYLAITFGGVQPLDTLGDPIFSGSLVSANPVAGWDGSALGPNYDPVGAYKITLTGVPEPGTFVLMLAGLIALGFRPSRFVRG